MALSEMAGVVTAIGQPVQAVHLLGAVEAELEALNKEKDPVAQIESDRDTALAREKLDEAAFASAWSEGRAMGLEKAIQEGRAITEKLIT